jgi:hypothetical protein
LGLAAVDQISALPAGAVAATVTIRSSRTPIAGKVTT